jgi:flagellin-specific chaperone FliS
MNPYQAYRRPEPAAASWTRMDLLLALYDKALERLDRAEASLAAGDEHPAVQQLLKVQFTVTELSAGVNLDVNPELGANLLRLYEYVAHELKAPRAEGVRNARKILKTLREGFEGVREEGNAIERRGMVPAADQARMVLATA